MLALLTATALTVELNATASPCDSQSCTRVERILVPELGTIEIDRVALPEPEATSLVVTVRQGNQSRWLPLAIEGDTCSTGTCIGRNTESVHLVRLDPKGSAAFGVELESTVRLSHTFHEMGPPESWAEHTRLACIARAGVTDCKLFIVDEHLEHCRVLGWKGTSVRTDCTRYEPLVTPRPDDTDGISQTDVEKLQQLDVDVRLAIGPNRGDCAELVKQLDKVIDRDRDAFAIARGHLPAWVSKAITHDVADLSGGGSCLLHEPSQRALERLFAALGTPTSFKLQTKR